MSFNTQHEGEGITLLWFHWANTNVSSATVWNGCITSPAVWGPSAYSCRLEVQLHWRLCRRSWCASDWREAYECQLSAVFLGERWRRGSIVSQVAGSVSRHRLVDQGGDLELDALPHWKPVHWWDEAASTSAYHQPSDSVLGRIGLSFEFRRGHFERLCISYHGAIQVLSLYCIVFPVASWVAGTLASRAGCGSDERK